MNTENRQRITKGVALLCILFHIKNFHFKDLIQKGEIFYAIPKYQNDTLKLGFDTLEAFNYGFSISKVSNWHLGINFWHFGICAYQSVDWQSLITAEQVLTCEDGSVFISNSENMHKSRFRLSGNMHNLRF